MVKHENIDPSGGDLPEKGPHEQLHDTSAVLFHHVMDSMLRGYVNWQVVFEEGKPVDFIFREFNQAYQRLTGIEKVEGRRLSEVMTCSRDQHHGLFPKLLDVAESGHSMSVEWRVPESGLWFESTICRPRQDTVVAIIDNVTHRWIDAHVMQECEDRFSTIIRVAGIGTWDWDVLHDRIECNDRWFAMIGYRREEICPMSMARWRQQIHPEDVAAFDAYIDRYFLDESADFDIECRMRRSDGKWVWVRDRGKVLARTPDGKPLRMLGTHVDITIRKEAEAARQERETLFRSLFESYAAIQLIVDAASGSIIDANQAAAEFYGWSVDDLRGVTLMKINPHLKNHHEYDLLTLDSGRQTRSVCRHIMADGAMRNVEAFRTRISIGDRQLVHVVIHDITERLQTERRLSESETRFRSLFENHSAVMLILDPDTGRIVDANHAAAEFYGWSRSQLQRMRIQEINTSPAEDIRRALDSGCAKTQTHFRFRHRTAESVRDVDVYSSGVQIDHKMYLYSIIHDVTEKLRTEAQLKESEELFRGLFEDHSAMMVIIDPETGMLVDANQAAADFYGWSREELKCMNLVQLNCDEPVAIRRELDRWKKLDHRCLSVTHRRADGSVRNVEVFAKKLLIKGRALIFDIIHDVTERKRLEAFAALRLELLEMAGSSSVAVMLQTTLDEVERATGSSIGFCVFIAKDQNTLLLHAVSSNTSSRMCNTGSDALHAALIRAGVWADAVRERRSVIHNDYRTLPHRKGLPEGHAAIEREIVVPVIRGDLVVAVFGIGNKPFDYDEDDARWLQSVADLTWDVIEKKTAEDEYLGLQEQLQQSRKMEMIGQLASGIAHEINNPLNFIQINHACEQDYFSDFLDLFKRYREIIGSIRDGMPPDQIDFQELQRSEEQLQLSSLLSELPDIFTETQKGIDRIKKIVEGMRSLSYRNREERKALSDINKAIQEVLVVARGEYRFHADIMTRLENVPPVSCFIDQISQVLLNLIINSVHAIQSQHRATNGKIDIHTWTDGVCVYCSVSDDGPGISESIRTDIFNPFFTTKPPGKGTGLGLSISYDIIVNKHGGRIIFDCPSEGGTVFTIALPL